MNKNTSNSIRCIGQSNQYSIILIFLLISISMLFLISDCGTFTQVRVKPPLNEPSGFVEFYFDDTSRELAHGWTASISEMISGNIKKYGFLGRDLFWAPFGYAKVRRISLKTGHHTLNLRCRSSELGRKPKPINISVDVDVVDSKLIPIAICIEKLGPKRYTISYVIKPFIDF